MITEYKTRNQYMVEIPIPGLVKILKEAGVLPADMKPEHDVTAGVAIRANIVGPTKAQCLTISWHETEEIDKDGKSKTRKAVTAAAKLRGQSRKKKR
ncbi:MAG: hypothetical protein KAJ19_20645 [Gammaproteobacteria bacterium]|nr:hypothetical protein [Gammaproteobacteria bacterium]